MAKDKKFHQTPLGNVVCALIGIALAVVAVLFIK